MTSHALTVTGICAVNLVLYGFFLLQAFLYFLEEKC